MDKLTAEEKKEKIRQILNNKQNLAQSTTSVKQDTNSIPDSFYKIDRIAEIVEYNNKYSRLLDQNIQDPFFRVNEGIINDRTIINGVELISYSSYNYLGFSGHKKVSEAAKKAIDSYGTSVSASRMVTGEKGIHLQLEKELANFLNVEDSLVLVGGHATNVTVIGHLFGPRDLILHDALAHNSIVQGALLAKSKRIPFPHNDWAALELILQENRMQYEKVLIAIEGVYSVDGDIPDLPKFIEIKKKYKTWLMVDEAHSIGVLGKTGRGIGEYYDLNHDDVDIWMGTLSKTFASCGGYIGGNGQLIRYLKHTTPGFMFSVGIPPANAGAALAVLDLLKEDHQCVTQLQANAMYFLENAIQLGLNTGLSRDSAIIPVIVGDSLKAIKLTNFLFDNGINVMPILYPAVPEPDARLRFFITSHHNEDQMRYTLNKVKEGMEKG